MPADARRSGSRHWLRFLSGLGLGACLADDMGLGKTVQLLALLSAFEEPRESKKTIAAGSAGVAVGQLEGGEQMLSNHSAQTAIMDVRERQDGIPPWRKESPMVLPPPVDSKKKGRKHLSADALYALVGGSFARVPDPRRPDSPIPLPNALLSAFALFSLKDPSLLAFDQRNLSVVFAMLMMLAFLVDQAQQLCCPLFRAAWKKLGSKRALWDNLRSHFRHFRIPSMRQLYEAILYDLAKEVPLPGLDTS